MKVSNQKLAPGKISMKTASAIINARKALRLSHGDAKALFRAAKSDSKFTPENIPKYAAALKDGKKDFIDHVKPIKRVALQFTMLQEEWEALEDKYVYNGPFQTVQSLIIAILKGEKSIKINVKGRY